MSEENALGTKKPGRPSKQAEEGEEKVTLTLSELKQLIAESKSEDSASIGRAIAQELAVALADLKKPYVDPKKAENDAMMAEQSRLLQERLRRTLELDRQSCPHLQGSNALSEEQGTRTSIWWHRLDSGTYWGICSNCQRQFWPNDPDYRAWRAKKSGNRQSQAGERQFVDTKAWERAEHPEPFSSPVGSF